MRGGSCAFLMLALAVGGLAADESSVQRPRELAAEGRHAEALRAVEDLLATAPGSVEALLLKGVVLAEAGRLQEAEEVFVDLTRRAPERPEPFNNLAVLYGRQGDYERAAGMLEQALETHSSYGTAHRNLVKVRRRESGRAYDRALGQESGGATGGPWLEWLSDVPEHASSADVGETAAAGAGAGSPPSRDQPTEEAPAQLPAQTPAGAGEPSAPAAPAQTGPEFDAAGVVETIRAWARAWSERRADDYVAFYSQTFRPEDGSTRAAWIARRRQQILAPGALEVEVGSIGVRQVGDDGAQARFVESYGSEGSGGRASKTLELVREGGGWKILTESSSRN